MKLVHYKLDGHDFQALTQGDATNPMILFLHGFPEYSGAWTEIMDRLSATYFCVAPDQRGYGGSYRPDGVAAYAVKHLASDAAGTIAHFAGDTPVSVVGHDWGASVAYATAIRCPERVANLTIINGVHPAPFQKALAAGGAQSKASRYMTWLRSPGSAAALIKDDYARMFDLFSANMDMSWLTDARRRAYQAAWGGLDGVAAMVNWYRASPLQVAEPDHPIAAQDLPVWSAEHLRITMPHLLIWGPGDTALLAEARDGLDEYCADLTTVFIEDGDHWVIHQRPDDVAHNIRLFLDAQRQTAGT